MRTAAKGLIGLGILAAGVAVGALVERAVARRVMGLEEGEPMPALGIEPPAQSLEVMTDDGVALHVEIAGRTDPAAPTVIFTHGYALSLDSWPHQRAEIANVARIVLWDQRGHGRSARGPAGTTIERLGQDLGCVLDAVAPDGPVVLVGHSMGGMTIMALAAERPELFGTVVRGVALLATSSGGIADVDLGLPWPIARLAHRVAPSIGTAVVSGGPVATLVDHARRSTSDLGLMITRAYAFGSTVPPEGTRLVTDLITGTPVDVLADLLTALEEHDKAEALDALADVDLLVMVGEADLLTPPGHSIEIVRRVPHAELVILPEVGHMIALEAADDVSRRICDLVLRSCPA